MTFSNLPGLLSRFGPSLFSPAMLYEPAPIRFASTQTFLDSFQAHPEAGEVFMPIVAEGPSSREMSVRSLGEENFAEARRTVEAMISEGNRFLGADESVRETSRPVLPATEGVWHLGESIGGRDAALTLFKSSRRFVRVGLLGDGGLHVGTGWGDSRIRLSQSVAIDGRGRFATGGFQFEFMGAAIEGLKALMGRPESGGPEVALELAAALYGNGQYSPQESGCSLQIMSRNSRWVDLSRTDGAWRLPPDWNPQEPLVVGTKASVPRIDRSKVRLPVAETYWETKDGSRGHLLVRLHNLPGRRLLLHEDFKTLLWDGALNLLFGQAG